MQQYLIESHCRGAAVNCPSTTYHLVDESTGTHLSVSSTLEGLYDFCMAHKPRIIIEKIHLLLNATDKMRWSMIPLMKRTKSRIKRGHAANSRPH